MGASQSGSDDGPPPGFSVAEYRTLARFRYALRSFLRFSEEAARRAGLTPAQHQLLLAIRGHEGDEAPSLTETAERLQLRLHSTSELVDRAVGNGLVARGVDGADHRRVLLQLTEDGEARLADLSVQHRAELNRFRDEMADLLLDANDGRPSSTGGAG